jgi:acetyl esterase/lipase
MLLVGVALSVLCLGSGIALAYRGDVSPLPSSEPAAAAGEVAGGAAHEIAELITTTTQAPDALPNPGVGPGECKFVTYTPPAAREKQMGELCRPLAAQRDAAVILVHGGAGVGGTYAGMKPWSNRLNTEGYVTFAVEYHLFSEGSASPVFPWPEQNIKASVQYLRGTANALGIRNNRIAVEGFSAGARLAAVAATTPNDPYFLGNELWPFISDEVNALVGFYHPLDGSMQYQAQYYGGEDESADPRVRERWDKADSLSHAAQSTGPAAFFTGELDWDIQITQMAQFVQTLQAAGKDGALIVAPGGWHGFDIGDGVRLSRLGEQSATGVLLFLNKAFPQTPDRPAQANPADVVNAPNNTGLPPSSFAPRPKATANTSITSGRYPTTTRSNYAVPPSKPYIPPTSVKPTVTVAPTSMPITVSTAPPTSAPPTSAPG